jgi:hypothetical protein
MLPPNLNDDEALERELRRALTRVEPDKDFSALFYSRSHVGFWKESKGMLALAAALVFMLLMPIGMLQYQARQRRGEEAREQLITALRITGSKLQKTRLMVVRERRNTQ